jgi:hypothetical protein
MSLQNVSDDILAIRRRVLEGALRAMKAYGPASALDEAEAYLEAEVLEAISEVVKDGIEGNLAEIKAELARRTSKPVSSTGCYIHLAPETHNE